MTSFGTLLVLCSLLAQALGRYDPNWDSLDTRPLPEWYDKAKVGIFLHWGVYSVPSFQSEWFWRYWADREDLVMKFMEDNYPPGWTYQDFAPSFTAEFYDPESWVDLFQRAGAKYVVLTSKHHEGYAMWPSKYSYNWNAMDVGPHRDLLGDLATAVKEKGLHFGIYHSLLEWFNPIYIYDILHLWTTSTFVDTKVIPEMKELINNYHPEVLWSDGDWEAADVYWKATDFIAWLYNDSPVNATIVTNNRWGANLECDHGDFYTCTDRESPGVLQNHKWENAMTLDRRSWGYRRTMSIDEILSADELVETLITTVSCGGNILINVGPTKEGTIVPIFQQRLLELGTWLGINGEAIYESTPWSVQNDTQTSTVWYTTRNDSVYAITLNWPDENVLSLGSANSLFDGKEIQVTLLGNSDSPLSWEVFNNRVFITFPDRATVVSDWAWVVKITPT